MAKQKRGRVILYDQVADDAMEMILKVQAHLKQKMKIGRVSLSTAITKIVRAHKLEE